MQEVLDYSISTLGWCFCFLRVWLCPEMPKLIRGSGCGFPVPSVELGMKSN